MQWPTEKKDKRTHNELLITTQKTKEQATRTTLKTGGDASEGYEVRALQVAPVVVITTLRQFY